MNTQDQNVFGRHCWNQCVGRWDEKLLEENGAILHVLDDGYGGVLDLERFVVLLKADRPVFSRETPIPNGTPIEAEVFPRMTPKALSKSAPVTAPLSAEALWTWRSVWDRICGLEDAERAHRTMTRIVDGDVPGKTVLVTCGDLVWRLTSPNPNAFRRDPNREGVWLPLPADAPIDGTMTA